MPREPERRRLAAVPSVVDKGSVPEATPVPDAPAGLDRGGPGADFWAKKNRELEMSSDELVLLAEMCFNLDTIAELRRIVAEQGLMVPTLPAGMKVNPAAVELRARQVLLARQHATMRFPDVEEDEPLRRPQRRGAARGAYSPGRAG